MATVGSKQATELRKLILRAISGLSYRPIELLRELHSREITESALKDELAELLSAGIIELSPDRRIKLRKPLSAAR